jgi:hypothetical protein
MPVRRFHSIEEMNAPVWRHPGDPDLYRAIESLWDFGQRTSSERFRPGVWRFRSIVEMSEHDLRDRKHER